MHNNKLTKLETNFLRILAKKHILLPTKNKKPLVKNWNKFYAEYRSIEKLLELNGEYSLRTGTKIWSYYFVVIDLDDLWAKIRIKESRFVETRKGIHCYIWIKELPKSCYLVNETGEVIGQLHSKGRFVVGIGSIHESKIRYSLKGSVRNKFFLKFETLLELQQFLEERGIFTTSWGKTGKENIRDLEFYEEKSKRSKTVQYLPKKENKIRI